MVTLVLILYINGFGSPPAKVHLDYPSFEACEADLLDAMKVPGATGYCVQTPAIAERDRLRYSATSTYLPRCATSRGACASAETDSPSP
jgi:hypothetical protein